MGDLANAFAEYLALLNQANNEKSPTLKAQLKPGLDKAASTVNDRYKAYSPTSPEDPYDAAAARLIEKVEDLSMFAALIYG